MANKQIRIIPKRRESIDTTRLAEALLNLVAMLDEKERAEFIAAGELALKEQQRGGEKRRRRSA